MGGSSGGSSYSGEADRLSRLGDTVAKMGNARNAANSVSGAFFGISDQAKTLSSQFGAMNANLGGQYGDAVAAATAAGKYRAGAGGASLKTEEVIDGADVMHARQSVDAITGKLTVDVEQQASDIVNQTIGARQNLISNNVSAASFKDIPDETVISQGGWEKMNELDADGNVNTYSAWNPLLETTTVIPGATAQQQADGKTQQIADRNNAIRESQERWDKAYNDTVKSLKAVQSANNEIIGSTGLMAEVTERIQVKFTELAQVGTSGFEGNTFDMIAMGGKAIRAQQNETLKTFKKQKEIMHINIDKAISEMFLSDLSVDLNAQARTLNQKIQEEQANTNSMFQWIQTGISAIGLIGSIAVPALAPAFIGGAAVINSGIGASVPRGGRSSHY